MISPNHTLRVALVFDWLTTPYGGVERLVPMLLDIFPHADIFTSSWNPACVPIDTTRHHVVQSWLRVLPYRIQKMRKLWILMYPYMFESFDFTGYDVVISISSAFAKSIIVKPPARHISYLLTPTRYLWGNQSHYDSQVSRMGILGKAATLCVSRLLRAHDFIAAQRPQQLIAISKTVQQRIDAYYARPSIVVYPPFDVSYWQEIKKKAAHQSLMPSLPPSYFLLVSRLEPYKNIEMVLKVFNSLATPLIVVGNGSLNTQLRSHASHNIIFMGEVSDQDLALLYMHANALIMPQEEDFGYVAIESLFFGCPVISYCQGGGSESVIHGFNGLLFTSQTAQALTNALAEYQRVSYNLHKNLAGDTQIADRFGTERFKREFESIVYNQLHID